MTTIYFQGRVGPGDEFVDLGSRTESDPTRAWVMLVTDFPEYSKYNDLLVREGKMGNWRLHKVVRTPRLVEA